MLATSSTTFIAARYLKASRHHRFFSWVSTLSILGIGIGVAVMIVVLSVINGFERELRERFLAANAHVLIYRYPAGLTDYQNWQKDLNRAFGEEITGSSPFVYADTMARKDYMNFSILIRGIPPKERQSVQDLTPVVRPESALQELQTEFEANQEGKPLPATPGVILGRGLLTLMNAKIGDEVGIISPKEDVDGGFRDAKQFKIIGVYDSGLSHYDNKLGMISLPAAQDLFRMGDLVTGLEVGLKNPNKSVETSLRMEQRYGVSVKEWQSYNKGIFDAMNTERVVISFIVALVAFVASFNILTTLFVLVTLKRRDIAILRAMGMQRPQILAIFLKQSFYMGLIGSLGGVCLALVISYLLRYYPFIDLPDIYLLAHLPVMFDPKVYLGVSVATLVITIFAGTYPSLAATWIPPTEGMRQRG